MDLLCGGVRGFTAGQCAVGHRASFAVDHGARFVVTQGHPRGPRMDSL